MSGRTDNAIRIAAPMELVWSVTNDVAGWPQLFSEYAAAEILHTAPNYVRFRLTTHPEDGRSWSWVSERELDPVNRVVTARRVEPGPFEYMRLRWEYRQVGDEVELRWQQEFQMRPDAPVDDAAMTERINRNSPIQLARIKQILESGGPSPTPEQESSPSLERAPEQESSPSLERAP
ncbi:MULTISPECIES: SRPBCC family protein [unclassified Solwaraspora]|uniref:SRPBCC family protein n=1 Tax=unclassified Solwaraspora TaxID=2627926 RepID=UPI00259AF07A|nr:SRPBCC family protein [Solwaraspora sp. WMMA2056]WJK38230.1 SRPBCC family protein [Solwaraspora sp. WMMA2056]